MSNLLIAVEGIDGAGKSTYARELADHLHKRLTHTNPKGGFHIEVVAFPTSSATGTATRAAINTYTGNPHRLADMFAYDRMMWAHERAQATEDTDTLKITICDRYIASGVAYRYATTADTYPSESDAMDAAIMAANVEIEDAEVPAPDLTIWLNTDPGVARARMGKHGTLDEFEKDTSLQVRALQAFALMSSRDQFGLWAETSTSFDDTTRLADLSFFALTIAAATQEEPA